MSKNLKWSPDNKFVKQLFEFIISRQWVPYPEWTIDTVINHIYGKKFSCLQNAVLLRREEGEKKEYPVIIFSHGLSSHMHSHSTMAK